MSYMQELETQLSTRLSAISDVAADEQDAFVEYVKALVLQSYRNGLKAGAAKPQKQEPVKATR